MRMPLIVYHPEWAEAGQQLARSEQMINNTDYALTLLSMAGLKSTSDYMQGVDFSAALA